MEIEMLLLEISKWNETHDMNIIFEGVQVQDKMRSCMKKTKTEIG